MSYMIEVVFDKYQLRGLCENAKGVNEFTKIATYDSLKCDAVLANVYKVILYLMFLIELSTMILK